MKQIFVIFCIIFTFVFTGCTRNNFNNMESGDEAFNQKDYVSAIKYYKKEIKKNPQNAQAYSQYCGAESYAYDKNKKINLNNTLSFCNKSLELDSNIAETYFYKGRIYNQLEKNKEAIQEYSNAIKINSNYERAYFNRGICESRLGMIKEAISDYSKAIELKNEEDLLLALYNRGFAYLQIKDKEKADSDFKKVANFDIKNGTALDYALRGGVKKELKDYLGAIFDFTKAIELDNNNSDYYYLLSVVKILNSDYEGAIDLCNIGISKFQNAEALYFSRGTANFGHKMINCVSNRETCHFNYNDFQDILYARQLAIKNNNQDIYQQTIEFEKNINNIASEFNKNNSNKDTYDNSSNIIDSNENTMNEYYEDKINKGILKFNMAKQQNDIVNACISDRFVAQYYYDLIDEQNYNKWKNIEKQSCSWMNY